MLEEASTTKEIKYRHNCMKTESFAINEYGVLTMKGTKSFD